MEVRFLDAVRPLSAVVGVCLDGILAQLRHDQDVDYSARGHHQVHEHEQCIRRVEAGEEHDHEDEHVHRYELPFLLSEEQDVVLADDVICHQAGECEYEEEYRDEVRCESSVCGFEHMLEQHGGFEVQVDGRAVAYACHDDECGHGAYDGVDQDTEGLGETLGHRVADIRHGREVGDGTDSGLVGEDTPLHSDDQHGTDTSSDGCGYGERVGEDGCEGIDDTIVVHHDGYEADDYPDECHDRDDTDGHVGDPLDTADDNECGQQGEDDREDELVVLEVEGTDHRLGHAADLHRDESDDVHQHDDDGDYDGHPLETESVGHVVCGSAVELTVVRAHLVYLSDRGLQEAGGHTDYREHPYPEYGSRSAYDEGQDGTGDVAHSDTVAHAHAEHAER